ncbi:sensor histidine kinase [Desulfothermobacter acidiphilus]|uniref:sensor histidine kinase n=1 Tax=Desulfothermobacter acidiphilus TaxID=1938353 RepID=UPI003F899EE5
MSVFLLAGKLNGLPYLGRDALYAGAMALAFFSGGFLWEVAVRWPFWQALERWSGEGVGAGLPPPPAPTWEGKLVREALARWDRAWRRDQAQQREKLLFYTTLSLRAAHHMKTPLQTLTLLLFEMDRAVKEGKGKESWQVLRSAFTTEISRLNSLAGQILHALRLEDSSKDFLPQRFNLVELVREVVNTYREDWVWRRIYPSFQVEGEEKDYQVCGDRKWAHLVVEQIIKNALQYGRRPHQETARFWISFSQRERAFQVRFRDEGWGILPEELGRIFDPFFTGAAGRKATGATGIGLYLAREGARRIGAEIQVAFSAPGQGTEFVLNFPQPQYLSPALEDDAQVTKL